MCDKRETNTLLCSFHEKGHVIHFCDKIVGVPQNI